MKEDNNIHGFEDGLDFLKIETRSGESVTGKPKVYFTCHEKDVGFRGDICRKILDIVNCAIYYIDTDKEIDDDDKDSVLARMNLFVVPVSPELLRKESEGCRAMRDVNYAKEHHLHILPIVLQPGLDSFYSAENKFGKRHYLKYEELESDNKLAKYLESVLISQEIMQEIRRAFSASIFLSYRKKDKKHASALIKKIHESEELHDIAVWFDDYLTPGEDFEENIKSAMDNSKIFVLLVTKSLLEDPNYIKDKEYPAAKDNAKKRVIPIIPVEVKEQSARLSVDEIDVFKKMYIPCDTVQKTVYYDSIVSADGINERLIELLRDSRVDTVKEPSERDYLLGLAYLNGVDSEINSNLAVRFLTRSAERGNIKAMKVLYRMYAEGIGVSLNYKKSVEWCEKIVEHINAEKTEKDEETLGWDDKLIWEYSNNGEYKKALALSEQTYKAYSEIIDKDSAEILALLGNISSAYIQIGNYKRAIELGKRVYKAQLRIFTENNDEVITTIDRLAMAYCYCENYPEAIEFAEKAYKLSLQMHEEDHYYPLTLLSNLALVYQKAGDHKKAIEYGERAYKLNCDTYGADHPNSLAPLSTLGMAYCYDGNTTKAKKHVKNAYNLSREVLGDDHPDTLLVLTNLAFVYYNEEDYANAVKYGKKAYELKLTALPKNHPDTLLSLHNLAFAYAKDKKYSKAVEYGELTHRLYRDIYGRSHKQIPGVLKMLIDSLSIIRKQMHSRGAVSEANQAEKRLEELMTEYIRLCNSPFYP